MRPESLRRYSDTVRLHLTPTLGRFVLAKLQPEQVEAAYSQLADQGLSGTTVRMAHGVLRTALRDATRRGHTQRNVCDLVDAPRRSTGEQASLTPEQARRLLAAAEGDPLDAFFTLAITFGMRLGELQALRWASVDMDRRRLRVVATFQGFEDARPVFHEPKTAAGRRVVQLSRYAIESLREHRKRQLQQRLQAGPVWEDHGLVFTNGRGRPLDGNNIRTRAFAPLLERAGLPPMRFHSLRHAAASLLLAEGVGVKVISQVLGHADVSVTLRIYAHLLGDAQDAAADAMDRLFSTGS